MLMVTDKKSVIQIFFSQINPNHSQNSTASKMEKLVKPEMEQKQLMVQLIWFPTLQQVYSQKHG